MHSSMYVMCVGDSMSRVWKFPKFFLPHGYVHAYQKLANSDMVGCKIENCVLF